MYICLCKGITEKQLSDAVIGRSHQSTKEILKSLGVGSDCGTCLEDAISKIKSQHHHSKSSPRPSSFRYTKQN